MLMLLHQHKRPRVLVDSQASNLEANAFDPHVLIASIKAMQDSCPSHEILAEKLLQLASKNSKVAQLLDKRVVQALQPDLYWLMHLAGLLSFQQYLMTLTSISDGNDLLCTFLRNQLAQSVDEQDAFVFGSAVDIIKYLFNEISTKSECAVCCQNMIISISVPGSHSTKLTTHDILASTAMFRHLNTTSNLAAVAELQLHTLSQLYTRTMASPLPSPHTPAVSVLQHFYGSLQPGVLSSSLSHALHPTIASPNLLHTLGVDSMSPLPSPLCIHRNFLLRQSSVSTQSFFTLLLELVIWRGEGPCAIIPMLQEVVDMASEGAIVAMATENAELFLRSVALVDHFDHIISHTSTMKAGAHSTGLQCIMTPWLSSLLSLPPTSLNQPPQNLKFKPSAAASSSNPRLAVFAVYTLNDYMNQSSVSLPSLHRIGHALKPLHSGIRRGTAGGAVAVSAATRIGAGSLDLSEAVAVVWQLLQARVLEFDGKSKSAASSKTGTMADFLCATAASKPMTAATAQTGEHQVEDLVCRLVPEGHRLHISQFLKLLNIVSKLNVAEDGVNGYKQSISLLHSHCRAALHTAAADGGVEVYTTVSSLISASLVSFVTTSSASISDATSASTVYTRIDDVLLPIINEGSGTGLLGSLSSGLMESVVYGLLESDAPYGADKVGLVLKSLQENGRIEEQQIVLERLMGLTQTQKERIERLNR